MTERLHFHFSLSCIGEGNGNPLQYSCLENSRDRGACWAAIYGVAQSRTWLKRLSSSSRRSPRPVTIVALLFMSMGYREIHFKKAEIVCELRSPHMYSITSLLAPPVLLCGLLPSHCSVNALSPPSLLHAARLSPKGASLQTDFFLSPSEFKVKREFSSRYLISAGKKTS